MTTSDRDRGRFALDIECVSLVDEPDFGVPEHWRPFCIGLCYDPPGSDPIQSEVLFSKGNSLESEEYLINEAIGWISRMDPVILDGEPAPVITYNGDFYDIPILTHRLDLIDRQLDARLMHKWRIALTPRPYIDLIRPMRDRLGYYPSIDDSLAMHGMIDMERDRPVDGEDMLDLGERVLDGDVSEEELENIKEYQLSDVLPLLDLHDRLENKENQG